MNSIKITLRYALILAFVALICSVISIAVYQLTKENITKAMNEQQKQMLMQVIPQQYFDNDLLKTAATPNISLKNIEKIYFAMKNQRVTAYAYETIAPDGYSGNIRLLVGITPEGEILGVRVIEHHETPGLGDKIETRISDWILSFTHKFIQPDNLNDWAVKKDGGKFDQFSGATITPRAIVNQVKRSALTLLEHKTELTAPLKQ